MFQENLRLKRKERGLSQEELASRLHVVRQTISKWEKGVSILETPTNTQAHRRKRTLESPLPESLRPGTSTPASQPRPGKEGYEQMAALFLKDRQ